MKVYKSLALALMLSLAGCGSSEDSVAKYIESGNEYFEAGQYGKARVEYKNALQIDPRQAEPYYKLALIAETKQNWKGVFNNLTVVEQLQPNHIEALLKIGKIYVVSGQYEEGLKRADKVLSLEPENLTAKTLKASIFTKQEDYQAAESLLNEVLKADPDNFDALTLQIAFYKAQDKHDLAEKKLEKALNKYPNDTALNLIKLKLLEEEKNYIEIAKIHKKLLQQQPDKWELVSSYARLQATELDNYDEAVSAIESYIDKHPAHSESKLLLLTLLKSKDNNAAVAKLAEFIEQNPKNYDLRFLQVSMMTDEQEIKAALRNIIAEDGQGSSANKAKVALANLAASKNDFETSKKLVSEVLSSEPEQPGALLLNAKFLLNDGSVDEAITNLRSAINHKPDLDEAYIYLAQAYSRTGSTDLAQKTIREALDANPYNVQAALAVATQFAANEDFDRAEDVLSTAFQQNQDNPELIQAITHIKILQNDWDGGQKTIELLKTTTGGETAVSHMLSGELLASQNNYDLAIEEFKAALTLSPNSRNAMRSLARVYAIIEKPDAFISYLNDFINKNSSVLLGYQVLADVYANVEQWDKAFQTINDALAKTPEWLDGYNTLASLYKRQGEIDKQIETYRRGANTNPKSLELKILLASALEGDGQYKEAAKYYEKVLEVNPKASIAINNLASILTDKMGSPEDLQRALEISKVFIDSTEPYFMDTYAWVNVKLGEYGKAEPILKSAALAAPEVPIIAYHLAILYQKQGKEIEAERQFKKTRELAHEKGDTEVLKLLNDIGK